jgi:prepilin-type N-terminal cleavage/methylation domain-containing protein
MRGHAGSNSRNVSARTSAVWSRRGFTLIELLIVVVIIGILSATAIPKFSATKGAAYLASMKADLRNLAIAEEVYASENGGVFYNGSIPNAALIYNPSGGVAVTLSNVTVTGWGAVASHPGTTRTCAFYIGTGGPIGPATVEGHVACTP